MTVFILTYCRNIDLLHGSTLIFDTIRTGFPTAEVVVCDNSSLPEARSEIKRLAEREACKFIQIENEISHWEFLTKIIFNAKGTIVFLDPDVIFWENCEQWEFNSLMAGRYLPTFNDPYTKTMTLERLHTSFLWIPSAENLTAKVYESVLNNFDFMPIKPFSFLFGEELYWYDTLGSLYSLYKNDCHNFTEYELSSYDHLFVGSHSDRVIPHLPEKYQEMIKTSNELAVRDPQKLKGLWKQQEEFFNEMEII